ncbi:hypothetical protein [Streptomyces sp. AK02-01A]|uniref:hypothetical protein n=1 Tax=Streptomyces sp. AK02-01A TaxID=3028648 RepID=UPI0029A18A12|nr:hypothetical protein [Streptomyces sp. AK02-01A]MDX3852180.1 hypothetical protein [Streptomyces sp. AK02-01A]
MISRAALPPPPPPEETCPWPDREARLADRAAAMVTLTGRGLGIGRLVLLWLVAAVAVVGWAAVGLAIESFEQGGLGQVTGLVALVLAAVFLVPAAVAVGFWLSRGRDIRQRLDAWAALGPDRATDVRLRAHWRSVVWLLPSVVLCLLGVWETVRAVRPTGAGTESVTVGETVYALGLGITVLVTGLLGVTQSLRHQSWSERLLTPGPVRGGGGAHR